MFNQLDYQILEIIMDIDDDDDFLPGPPRKRSKLSPSSVRTQLQTTVHQGFNFSDFGAPKFVVNCK